MKTRIFILLGLFVQLNVQMNAQVVNKHGQQMLGNVDNTSDAGKPVSTAQQTALDLKANLASPIFTGTITTPLIIGGTAVGSNIIYKSTTGTGTTTGIAHQFVGGTDGGTVVQTILNNGNVGIGTTAPNSSALVDITSTTKGFAMPRMTSAQRKAIDTPVSGLEVYDADLKGQYTFDGTKWDCSNNPAGMVNYFANSTAPNGYMECNGQAVNRTQYAELFAAIGTVYGAGNGSTTFNLPELRGEFVRGADNGRGVDAGRSIGTWQVATAFMGDGDGGNIPTPNLGNATNWQVLGIDPDILPENTTNLTLSYTNPAATCVMNGASSTATASVCADFARTRPRNVALMPCIKF